MERATNGMENKERIITCGNKLDCNSVIDKSPEASTIKIENRYYCCNDCVKAFLKQEQRFTNARDGHRQRRIIDNYNPEANYQPIQARMQLDD
jgi:YHS domain-containing protein